MGCEEDPQGHPTLGALSSFLLSASFSLVSDGLSSRHRRMAQVLQFHSFSPWRRMDWKLSLTQIQGSESLLSLVRCKPRAGHRWVGRGGSRVTDRVTAQAQFLESSVGWWFHIVPEQLSNAWPRNSQAWFRSSLTPRLMVGQASQKLPGDRTVNAV